MRKSRPRYHNHLAAYGILILLLSTGFFTFIQLVGKTQQQLQVAAITSLAYFLWGVFHHLIDRNLHWKIVIEYLSFALFGFSAVWVLISVLG